MTSGRVYIGFFPLSSQSHYSGGFCDLVLLLTGTNSASRAETVYVLTERGNK